MDFSAYTEDNINIPIIPKYRELAVSLIWSFVLENEDLVKYFPDIKEKEHPERAFLWAILNTNMHKAVESLKSEARKQRSIKNEELDDNLVEIKPEIYEFIQAISAQKPHGGRVPYLLKKSSKLERKHKNPKVYRAVYSVFNPNQKKEEEKEPPVVKMSGRMMKKPDAKMEPENDDQEESYGEDYAQASMRSQTFE
mmetsp:Transcript_7729/g.6838  ORF Transcript_7729/g.6838 Transcript_7729/m.6838 type:complete len:196 (+) Transcript_7729:286-873(+)